LRNTPWRRAWKSGRERLHAPDEKERAMAKSQKKSNRETRKPKKEVKKVIAANPSTKGSPAKS
jgi:hypothetical protein